MTILDKIVAKKQAEVAEAQLHIPVKQLEEEVLFSRGCYSLKTFILDPVRTGIIAEFKRASPSKGLINGNALVSTVTQAYAAAGASALSVLTDTEFFGGRKADLVEARGVNGVPILRKDFMISEYQILEAKALGADIILLIAAILTPAEVAKFAKLAKSLGMNVLLEVHNSEELERSITPDLDAIGVNNRNLADFSVSLDHSFLLAEKIPAGFLKISESGISDPETIGQLRAAGFNGFLIGENFMRTADPGAAMKTFVKKLTYAPTKIL
jgi:indole-3-glycerol phosphate synthase